MTQLNGVFTGTAYPSVEFKIIAVDFTDGNDIYKILEKELNKLEIGILVNNVGMAGPAGLLFTEVEDEKILLDTINCNITSIVRMSKIVLSQMIPRKTGLVINVGSVTGVCPSPLITLYGATKVFLFNRTVIIRKSVFHDNLLCFQAFIEKFSLDLAYEVKPFGIIVQTLLPGFFVATNMSQ